MNWDQVEGQWKDVKGQLRAKWGKLTDDDLEEARGNRDQIIGRLQERYGDAKEDFREALDRLIDKL